MSIANQYRQPASGKPPKPTRKGKDSPKPSGSNLPSLKDFARRIEALKAEQDERTADIREVYAEVAQAGFDKTALGQAIAIRRKREKGGVKFELKETLVSEYLDQIEASHARAREGSEIGPAEMPSKAASAGHATDESPSTQLEAPDIPLDLIRDPELRERTRAERAA